MSLIGFFFKFISIDFALWFNAEENIQTTEFWKHFQAYLSEWRLVFWISFGVYIMESIIFVTWGSGKVQPFDSKKLHEHDSNASEEKI